MAGGAMDVEISLESEACLLVQTIAIDAKSNYQYIKPCSRKIYKCSYRPRLHQISVASHEHNRRGGGGDSHTHYLSQYTEVDYCY